MAEKIKSQASKQEPQMEVRYLHRDSGLRDSASFANGSIE